MPKLNVSILPRILHWLVATVVSVALATGYVMSDTGWNGVGLLSREILYFAHKTLGTFIIPIMATWIAIQSYKAFHRTVGSITLVKIFHFVLFLCVLLTVLLGFFASLIGGFTRDVLIINSFPDLYPDRDIRLSLQLYALHKELAGIVLIVTGLHFLGAIRHLRLFQGIVKAN